MLREALIKSECRTNSMSLRDLKRAAARRDPQLMAVVLSKGCNNSDARFRPRLRDAVGSPHRLTYDCSEGQRYRILDQRVPR